MRAHAVQVWKATLLGTYQDDFHDGAHDAGCCTLGVVPAGDNAVKKLAALADLHDEVHGVGVLERLSQAYDVGVLGQRPHDGHLTPDVLDVDAAAQLPLADGLAREHLARGRVRAPPRHAELAAPQLLAELVTPEQLLGAGLRGQALPQHGQRRPRLRRGGARRVGDGGQRGAGPHVGAAEAPATVPASATAGAASPLARKRPGHAAVAHRRGATRGSGRRPRVARLSGCRSLLLSLGGRRGYLSLPLPLPLPRAREDRRRETEENGAVVVDGFERQVAGSFLAGSFVHILPFLEFFNYFPTIRFAFLLVPQPF
jgi:hypothetical protein